MHDHSWSVGCLCNRRWHSKWSKHRDAQVVAISSQILSGILSPQWIRFMHCDLGLLIQHSIWTLGPTKITEETHSDPRDTSWSSNRYNPSSESILRCGQHRGSVLTVWSSWSKKSKNRLKSINFVQFVGIKFRSFFIFGFCFELFRFLGTFSRLWGTRSPKVDTI